VAMALIVLVAGFIVFLWIWHLPIWKTIDSGWAQALFGALGIGIAIAVPYKQRADALRAEGERRQDEARRIRLAIKDELIALEQKFSGANVIHLLALTGDEIFDRLLPINAVRFPIYNAVLDRLTLIDDDALRSEIIAAYEWADAMPIVADLNNRLLLEMRDIQAELHYRNDDFQRARHASQMIRLKEVRVGMQATCKNAIALVRALLPRL